MTILVDARRPSNPGWPVGAGALPPDTLSFEPSPDDRAWWAAESARLEPARLVRCPFWLYSRTERLRALAGRARTLESYLCRLRCDARPADRPAIDARLVVLARRVRRLCDLARESARLDKHYDRLAAESAALDDLGRGYIFPDSGTTA
jgi:hypothetical protein